MALKPARRPNLPATIASNLRAQIMSGELPAGVQLPGHRELAVMYSVSVGSVREAISMLISNGLIETRAGDRKSTRLNSSHIQKSRMPSSA